MSSVLKTLALELLSPVDLGIEGSPPEDFETLKENARSKARFYFERGGGTATLAEDTGLYVDALKDELGVKTRRWGAGPDATDEEWLAYFLRRMEHEENRSAKFVAVVAYIDADGNEYVFESEARGTILREPQATPLPGLPVSSVFVPEEYDVAFSALTHEQKSAVSHRGRALLKFMKHLNAV